jgi:hypothetical protein
MTRLEGASKEQQYEMISTQHGGYWQNGLIDHEILDKPDFTTTMIYTHLSKK